MIYDAGFMGVFFPVGLYYAGGTVYKHLGYGSVNTGFPGIDFADSPNSDFNAVSDATRVYIFDSSTGIEGDLAYFDLPASGYIDSWSNGQVAFVAYGTKVKVYNSLGGTHYATVYSNGVATTISIAASLSTYYLISSRDSYIYRKNYIDSTIERYNAGVWDVVLSSVTGNIPRAQSYNSNLYYYVAGTALLKKDNTTWKTFASLIYDFWIDATETIVLSGSSVFFITTTTGATEKEVDCGSQCYNFARYGNYMAIRCATKIVLLYNREIFAEVPVAAPVALINN
jgi:hypothetical protein